MSYILLRCPTHNRDQKLPFDLLQVATTEDDQRASRRLSAVNQEVSAGPWERLARPFKDGIYCIHCVNEGVRTPRPIDVADLPDLGLADRPIIFQSPAEFDASEQVAKLREVYPQAVRFVQTLPAQAAKYAANDVLSAIHPALQEIVRAQILPSDGSLYDFQARAIAAALAGHDVVVATPTASGKTLTYTLPILDTLVRDPSATALYLSPLVALTTDQLEFLTRFDQSKTDWDANSRRFSKYAAFRSLQIGSRQVNVARYDGSVLQGDRPFIRNKRPQYVLTTPDMLHMAMLNNGIGTDSWAYLFSGLRYVVVDELHTYRGVLGAAFANLVRRINRLCRAAGSSPQFLSASATLVDPDTTMERLIGRPCVIIDGADVPLQHREFVIWHASASDGTLSLTTQAKNALLHLLDERVRCIAFARSINEINDIYRFTSAELNEAGLASIRVSPFMRELTRSDKAEIIRSLKSGRLHAVISTSALSMGIDIGSLSASVIIGFPGSIANLWQQAGRAGRAGDGLIIFIADTGPLDQFFVNHPDTLFDLHAEPVYLNPDNPYVVRSHLLAAAGELPLTPDELPLFGNSARLIAEQLVEDGILAWDDDERLTFASDGDKTDRTPFRKLGFSIDVQTEEDRTLIVTIDSVRAQRALHKYACYQHIDTYYEVVNFNVDFERERGIILVQEIEHPEYITRARVEHQIEILDTKRELVFVSSNAGYGDFFCTTDVPGYYKIPLYGRRESFEYQPLGRAAPPSKQYQTQGLWIALNLQSFYWTYPLAEIQAGLNSLAGAIRLAVAVEELCDPSDVDAIGLLEHPDTTGPVIMVYDAIPGGIGICEAAFSRLDRVLWRAWQILEHCPYCSEHAESRGCPYCVTAQYGDEDTINRAVALAIVRPLVRTQAN